MLKYRHRPTGRAYMTLAAVLTIVIMALHAESNDARAAGCTRLLDYEFRVRCVKNKTE